MLGPNTGTGHTSTLLYVEPQARHIVACIRRVREGGHRWMAVKAEVQQAHNQALQAQACGHRVVHLPQLVPRRQRPHRRPVARFHAGVRQGPGDH